MLSSLTVLGTVKDGCGTSKYRQEWWSAASVMAVAPAAMGSKWPPIEVGAMR